MAHEPQKLSTQSAVEAIQSWAKNVNLRPGGRLPSERALANKLGLSRDTIRGALQTMQSKSLIVRSSPRIRTLAETKSRSTLISRSVVVFTALQSPQFAEQYPMQSEFLHTVLGTLEKAETFAITVSPRITKPEWIAQLLEEGPRGIIVLEDAIGQMLPILGRLTQCNTPIAVLGDVLPEPAWRNAWFDRIGSDHRDGCRQLMGYLARLGCKRILRVHSGEPGQPPLHWRVERDRGYEEGCLSHGIEVLPPVLFPFNSFICHTEDEFRTSVKMKLGFLYEAFRCGDPPNAILMDSDGLVPTIIAACRLLGLNPGKDVLVAGYDNYWELAFDRRFESEPPIATVEKHKSRMAEKLVDTVLKRIGGELPPAPREYAVQPELVDRHELINRASGGKELGALASADVF